MSEKEDAVKKRTRSLANFAEYQKVFSSDNGKKVLWDLMKHCGMLGTSHVPGDSHSTAYNEGSRTVALYILTKLNTNINLLEKRINAEIKREEDQYSPAQNIL